MPSSNSPFQPPTTTATTTQPLLPPSLKSPFQSLPPPPVPPPLSISTKRTIHISNLVMESAAGSGSDLEMLQKDEKEEK
ncbi:hypothetical protein E2C01_058490 [Portunus trituberculatus]|uniref:Uncharacterized protein n=1 Tax=Portunus trituberculatus TaxID=210409 RepID=A0A5B7H3B6_PORTR|nr:hypothetical protein [Portunus trituberculatus]